MSFGKEQVSYLVMTDKGTKFIVKYQSYPVRGWVAEYTESDEIDILGIFSSKAAALKAIYCI